MKTHLIYDIGTADEDYITTTYCRMYSDEWSEEFGENVDKYLTDDPKKCTCKRCFNALDKQLKNFDVILAKFQSEYGGIMEKLTQDLLDHGINATIEREGKIEYVDPINLPEKVWKKYLSND